MLEKYLNKLEYNKILDIVSSYCATYIGRSLSSSFYQIATKRLLHDY